MTEKTIQLEYVGSRNKKRVDVVKKQGSRQVRTTEMVDVKDPRCWEVITVENSVLYMPGQRLNRKQVESLMRGNSFTVQIGQPGQYKTHHSRY
ncbi:MAG: hypothetical protein VYC11_04260 [Candidatus Thermoplasmatota archaeon]|nr:hypothetical protein [Candidatus Thermoplasmatota archaeon]